jgi:hypothetical protein
MSFETRRAEHLPLLGLLWSSGALAHRLARAQRQ